jgi:hypothetical protein
MSQDYTLNQPKATTIQEALDEALGPERASIGQVFEAESVDDVHWLVHTAHLYDTRVRVGATPSPGVLTLSLTQLTAIRELDPVSGLVTVESGCTVAALNSTLNNDGLRLPPGYFADPKGTLSQALSSGEGGPLIVSMGGVLPDGMQFHTPIAPRRATGSNPDVMLATTQHRLAIVVWVTLRVDFSPASPAPVAFKGPGKDIVATARELLIAGIHVLSVHLLKGSRGLVTVTWEAQSDNDLQRILTAFRRPGFTTTDAKEPTPPLGRPQRALWTEILRATDGTARRGLWVGPLDMHGGWIRTKTLAPLGDDPHLEKVRTALDPQQTLQGECS